jgi:hypothetical protein
MNDISSIEESLEEHGFEKRSGETPKEYIQRVGRLNNIRQDVISEAADIYTRFKSSSETSVTDNELKILDIFIYQIHINNISEDSKDTTSTTHCDRAKYIILKLVSLSQSSLTKQISNAWCPPTVSRTQDRTVNRLAVIFTVTAGILLLYFQLMNQPYGWDFQTYRTAVEIVSAGENPYDLEVLKRYGHTYPYIYPPIVVPFLRLFTIPTNEILAIYIIEYGILCLFCATVLNIIAPEQTSVSIRLWGLSLLLGGFTGGYWVFWSGNSEFIILSVICIGLYLAHIDRWLASGFLLGLAGSIKIIPALVGGSYLLLNIPFEKRFRAVVGLISAPIVVFAGSAVFFPELFPSEFLTAVAREGGITQFAGEGYITNSPILYFWQDLFRLANIAPSYGIIVHALFSLGIISMFAIWLRTVDQPVIQISLAFVGILLVFPRIKPYYFVYAIPAVYLITASLEDQTGVFVFWDDFILVFLLPFLNRIGYIVLGRNGIRALHPVLTMGFQYLPILLLLVWVLYRFPYHAVSEDWKKDDRILHRALLD